MGHLRLPAILILLSWLGGCAVEPPKSNYDKFRTENPKSILVVPAVNRSVEVNAPDYFLSTITKPLAERGYYVFPVHLVETVLADDGLSDADLVHNGDPHKLGEMFGADSVLYITIESWEAKYVLVSTTVTVELKYTLKSTSTGEVLWENTKKVVYQPNNSNSGNLLADLVADAVAAAIAKATPNYIPLAKQANQQALYTLHQGLPAGPHDPMYQKDQANF